METDRRSKVAIVGGGPAGSVAALCLRKLGHEVVLFEKLKFPRYRIGESLLPGTMSILTRLGVFDKVKAAGFVKKRAATFIWGGERPPWSFTFATPKTAPWVFDHAFQVLRSEFDQILLDAAREWGAEVHEEHEVTGVELGANGGPVALTVTGAERQGTIEADFAIDASGARGVLAQKLNLREWDKYYRNMAVWSYFKGGKRFKGDLEGNIFSVTFKEGWIWIIPLKDDLYSVGVVTGIESNERIRELGAQAFYRECLQMCPLATEILATAEQCDEMRVLRDWSYQSKSLSMGHAFLCGDAGCFIDPLFSQGVHLATYSAMLAAAAIDHLGRSPGEAGEVHTWYDRAYREAYRRYHRFVSSFYAFNEEPDSKFWASRKIQGARDYRFQGVDWFTSLTGQHVDTGAEGVEEIEQGAATLGDLWRHGTREISDDYDETELAHRRVKWASDRLKQLQGLAGIRWKGQGVRLVPSFRVDPLTFKLESQSLIADDTGRTMNAYALTAGHQRFFESLITKPLPYKAVVDGLKDLKGQGTARQIVDRLLEERFLEGFDGSGKPVRIASALRFGGVGAEDDLS